MQSNKESNQKLIERFPFLIPRNRWTGKIPEDYDYSYTELDSMPDGWRKTFGEQMCEDIREELVRAEYLDQYRINETIIILSQTIRDFFKKSQKILGTLEQFSPFHAIYSRGLFQNDWR